MLCKQEVDGSIPSGSIRDYPVCELFTLHKHIPRRSLVISFGDQTPPIRDPGSKGPPREPEQAQVSS
jgi:hypothetical protein